MNVVFLQPNYPVEQQQFCRGLAAVGARVWGVGDTPPDAIDPSVRNALTDYLQVPRLMDEDDVVERVLVWLRGRSVDRIEALWEPLVVAAAKLRARTGVPGMSVDAVVGFRDKQLMKERLAAAGLRVPRSARVRSEREAWEAAEKVGFPLVIKPIAGAGSKDTWVATSAKEFTGALQATRHVMEASVEEFIDGEEFTFDTVCIAGRPVFTNVIQYLPKPLVARRNEWVSPAQVSVRDLDQPGMRPGVELGLGALRALGMGTGFTHMEWYRTSSGEAVFGEIACRAGGAHLVDQMNLTCEIDLFQEWARVACWGRFEASTERRFNVACIFKRAHGDGRIARIDGLDAYRRRFGPWVCWENLLPIGAPRRDWRLTLVSDGFLMVRHPDWDEAVRMTEIAAREIRLYAA